MQGFAREDRVARPEARALHEVGDVGQVQRKVAVVVGVQGPDDPVALDVEKQEMTDRRDGERDNGEDVQDAWTVEEGPARDRQRRKEQSATTTPMAIASAAAPLVRDPRSRASNAAASVPLPTNTRMHARAATRDSSVHQRA
jgi:hypothetical protein